MPPHRRPRIAAGWLPRQHGAWFMLTLPVVIGLLLRARDAVPFEAAVLAIAATWLAGYLAFNAATGWLKAPARRRLAARRPLVTYLLLAGVLAVTALLLAGAGLLGWAVVFGPLVALALWLASGRRERSVASGALTVAAASLMTLVTRFVTPDRLLTAWGTSPANAAVVLTGLVFGYLFGTVLYVKTMIRERGRSGWLVASVGWHAALTVLAAAGTAALGLGVGWPVLFAITALRSLLMPALARRRPVRPLAVGLVEIAITIGFVVVAALG